MFDKVKGISIKGGFYENESILNKLLKHRMNIVFGRNGSGKSSIARAFAEQKKDGIHNYAISFYGAAPLPETNDKGIFVFNEDFIDSNVKIDKIRSIVMFGKNIQLNSEIKAAKDELEKLREGLDTKNNESKTLDKEARRLKKIIEDDLRKGYLARLEKLDGGEKRLSSKIFESVIAEGDPDGDISWIEYAQTLDNRIEEYLSCLKGEKITPITSITLPDISKVNPLLARTVRPAKLSEEESRIISILSEDLADGHFLESTQRIIIDEERDFCPLCHQGISHNHREFLASRLQRFKDRQVNDFKTEILNETKRLTRVSISMPDIPDGIDRSRYDAVLKAVHELNMFMNGVEGVLIDKLDNPYAAAPEIDEDMFASLCSDVSAAVDAFNILISDYNDKITQVKALRKDIDKMNVILAAQESKNSISDYKKADSDATKAKGDVDRISGEISAKEEEIRQMQAQTDKIGAAMENINAYLRIIFGKDRLTLKSAENDTYLICSRGKVVPTKALSVGERNAIALAYFFACIVEQKAEDYDYSEPTLLVLDDPVSSFDLENKAGMISLIGQQCAKILKGCDSSKVLVLTHDYMTLRDLCTVRDNIAKQIPRSESSGTTEYIELQNGVAKDRETKYIRENNDYYQRLLNIYHYAKDEDPESNPYDANMGNIIRKFLEQYASFRYRKAWSELFSDESLSHLERSKKDAIQALYMRPVLNPESHGNADVYQPAEIQRIAKMVLAFLYLTDKPHLASYLDNPRQLDTIMHWTEEL